MTLLNAAFQVAEKYGLHESNIQKIYSKNKSIVEFNRGGGNPLLTLAVFRAYNACDFAPQFRNNEPHCSLEVQKWPKQSSDFPQSNHAAG